MIARVTLEIALGKEFDYLVPEECADAVEVGARVKVPFGSRQVLGCVTALPEDSPFANLKPIVRVIGKQSFVSPKILELARWMGEYYCCAPETALKTVLPEAVRREKSGWKEQLFVHLLPPVEPAPKLSKRQTDLLAAIRAGGDQPLQAVLDSTGTTSQTLRRLEDKGLLSIAPKISERDPYARETILPTQSLEFNAGQKNAFEQITGALDAAAAGPAKPGDPGRVFLLHGVTGSGKTEVYLQAIAHSLRQGKGAIVLVPEISLTPQTVERFKARFSSGPLQTLVAVLHSHLSAGERHDEWHKIRQGRARIVIGARSAVFAPVEPLGLIIVDEEHEHSYKQEEAPRYHARDVAVVRAGLENAVTVLGSATPCLESYYNAQRGKYRLLDMPVRADHKTLPIMRVVDMRQTARQDKGPPIFSPQLKEAILQRLERKEQTLLFLNRRGFATSLQCPLCGHVERCPNCSLSLTYHRAAALLRCHICAHEHPAPAVCPNVKCRNPAIRYSGLGTEKVEATLGKLFPHARVRRMDSDTMKRKEDYRRILREFRESRIDILLGTQMIAKGLHFPKVTLVGIIHADLGLHIPDFRAGERTFQLLTQVAGRAGRGDVEGEVFVQAFTPFHPAIQYARRHDFTGFYEQELDFRRQLSYPPLSRIALILLRGKHEEKVRLSAAHVKQELAKWPETFPDLTVAGPAPAPMARLKDEFRYQLQLRTKKMPALSKKLAALLGSLSLPDGVAVGVDIDPVNLM